MSEDARSRQVRPLVDELEALLVAASLRRRPLSVGAVNGHAKPVNGHRPGSKATAPHVSVIVPSRNEVESLPILLERLAALELRRTIEIVVVDDSDDDTVEAAERAAAQVGRPDCRIEIIHRSGHARRGGLSGAVVDGIRATTGRWICVMDADLQHPPELIPDMLHVAATEDCDVVVASRYCGGGSSAGLGGRYRRMTSRAATTAVAVSLPGVLRGLSDPMSGFFVVARDRLDITRLHPRGYKILLEVLGRHPDLRIAEHPFQFAPRHGGQSKTSLSHGVDLARQLADLRRDTTGAYRRGKVRGHCYDIHHIVGVESDRGLPELAKFEVDRLTPGPTIHVHVRRLQGLARGENIDLTQDCPTVSYVERMGFGVRVRVDGPEIDVEVSPYVARSPHVLYTNVVEPLLRWHLVGLGHALVHAACVADGDDAYLVTARTDTGKTTTMLKLLDQAPLTFLSDDLVVVRPDGTVLTYPKPLTISAHTVHALKDTNLSRWERIALVPQSRLHSREGRLLAFLLTRYRLPVASISTLVQRLVPPPKYHVERLVQGTRTGHSARVRGMFVIERGGDGGETIPPQRALEILHANCEDAFGFPPYETLERMLLAVSEDDLRTDEHAIVASALADVPTEVMRSETLDWADRIAGRIAERTLVDVATADRARAGLYQGTP